MEAAWARQQTIGARTQSNAIAVGTQGRRHEMNGNRYCVDSRRGRIIKDETDRGAARIRTGVFVFDGVYSSTVMEGLLVGEGGREGEQVQSFVYMAWSLLQPTTTFRTNRCQSKGWGGDEIRAKF